MHLAAAYALPRQLSPAAAGLQGGEDDDAAQQQQAQSQLELCCILWAGRPRSERQPSRCEVHAVHLAATFGGPHPELQVLGAQLLKVRASWLAPCLQTPRAVPRSTAAASCSHLPAAAAHALGPTASATSFCTGMWQEDGACDSQHRPLAVPACNLYPTSFRHVPSRPATLPGLPPSDSPPCPLCPSMPSMPSVRPALPPAPSHLQLSNLPPHGVLVNPATGGVLLALQPSPADAEEEAAAQRAAAPAGGAAAGQRSQGGALEGMEGDDVSPRSLAAAVARLAAYTSEEPAGEALGLATRWPPCVKLGVVTAHLHAAASRDGVASASARLSPPPRTRARRPPHAARSLPALPPGLQARCRTSSTPTCTAKRGQTAWAPWAPNPPAPWSPLHWRRAQRAQQAQRSRGSARCCARHTRCPASRTSC